MIFTSTGIEGAFLVDIEPHVDGRGFFARTFCHEEMAAHGMVGGFAQSSVSFNKVRGTLRGMHFQLPPHDEIKLVRCTSGAIHDVIVDLRHDSPTYKCWTGVELSADNHRALYIPAGIAHGFITLCENSEVFYQIEGPYVPEAARGVRWDDPAFAIQWPLRPAVISARDSAYSDFEAA